MNVCLTQTPEGLGDDLQASFSAWQRHALWARKEKAWSRAGSVTLRAELWSFSSSWASWETLWTPSSGLTEDVVVLFNPFLSHIFALTLPGPSLRLCSYLLQMHETYMTRIILLHVWNDYPLVKGSQCLHSSQGIRDAVQVPAGERIAKQCAGPEVHTSHKPCAWEAEPFSCPQRLLLKKDALQINWLSLTNQKMPFPEATVWGWTLFLFSLEIEPQSTSHVDSRVFFFFFLIGDIKWFRIRFWANETLFQASNTGQNKWLNSSPVV